MSQNEHDKGHESLIKTPKQLITVVVLAFLVPIVLITLLSQYITSIRRIDLSSPALSSKAVAERLKPVAEVTIAGASGSAAATAAAAPAAETPAAAPAAAKAVPAAEKTAAAPAAGNAEGKKIFETTCVVCHGTGVAGAPKAGDKAAWAPRLKQGMPALYHAAINGLNAMPARGGNPAYTDAQVKAAVDYLTSLAK